MRDDVRIDGYDLLAEDGRLRFADVIAAGLRLNRGTARVTSGAAKAAAATSAGSATAPGGPTAGLFTASSAGTYLDLGRGAGQPLLELQPPGPRTGVQLAALVSCLVQREFPALGPVQTFVADGGAEAGAAAVELALAHARRRFLRHHGEATWTRLLADLGPAASAGTREAAGGPTSPDELFFIFACEGAGHGRALGRRRVLRVPFNGRAADLVERLDGRPITAILDAPGGARAVLASGRVPQDLAALFLVECVQVEAGCRFADRAWLDAVAHACRAHGVLLGVDEVASFGRTGGLFAAAHDGLLPDVLWTGGASIAGLTVARDELARDAPAGWPRDAGDRTLQTSLACALIETLANVRDPLFEGRDYLENSRIKGEYLRLRLADASARHDEVFPEFSGLGGLWGLTVRWRDEVVRAGWQQGLRLLPSGAPGELSRLAIVLPVDVLTREIDALVEALDRSLAAVGAAHDES